MKRLLLVPAIIIAVGCGTSETAPEAQPGEAVPAFDPKEMQLSILEARIANKNAELASADADLAKIDAERQQLASQPAHTRLLWGRPAYRFDKLVSRGGL